jgi:predicted ester cyclase
MEAAKDTAAASIETMRRFIEEVQNSGRLEQIPDRLTPDFVDHTPAPGLTGDVEGVKGILGAIRAGFPDHDARIELQIAQDDLVATYKSFTGTHQGDFLGIPPTGKRATLRVMDFVRVRDGKIAEHWNVVDIAGLQTQLQG